MLPHIEAPPWFYNAYKTHHHRCIMTPWHFLPQAHVIALYTTAYSSPKSNTLFPDRQKNPAARFWTYTEVEQKEKVHEPGQTKVQIGQFYRPHFPDSPIIADKQTACRDYFWPGLSSLLGDTDMNAATSSVRRRRRASRAKGDGYNASLEPLGVLISQFSSELSPFVWPHNLAATRYFRLNFAESWFTQLEGMRVSCRQEFSMLLRLWAYYTETFLMRLLCDVMVCKRF